jgi:hypothetical protein
LTPTETRNRAVELAKVDTPAALALARAIEDPWFRSQALAWAARFAPETELRPILDEAHQSSWAAQDKYEIVGSSAWRLRAMIGRGDPNAAAREMPALLACAAEIDHPVSRLEALFLLFRSIFEVDSCRTAALGALIAAAQVAISWKSGYRLREVALMLASAGHRDEADQTINAMPDGKYRRQAVDWIAKGERQSPRPFFW